jgi:RIO-like serine/threonine protein kinase
MAERKLSRTTRTIVKIGDLVRHKSYGFIGMVIGVGKNGEIDLITSYRTRRIITTTMKRAYEKIQQASKR